jgi:hypothetical protein
MIGKSDIITKWERSGLLEHLDVVHHKTMAEMLERTVDILITNFKDNHEYIAGIALPFVCRAFAESGFVEFNPLHAVSFAIVERYSHRNATMFLNDTNYFYGIERDAEFVSLITERFITEFLGLELTSRI